MGNMQGTAIAALATLLLTSPQGGRKPLDATASVTPSSVKPGAQGVFKITLHLIEGVHVNASITSDPYLIPTVFTPNAMAAVRWGVVEYPEPVQATEWYSTEPLLVYRDTAVITVPFQVAPHTTAKQAELSGILEAQACDHEQCYPPRRITLTARIKIEPPR